MVLCWWCRGLERNFVIHEGCSYLFLAGLGMIMCLEVLNGQIKMLPPFSPVVYSRATAPWAEQEGFRHSREWYVTPLCLGFQEIYYLLVTITFKCQFKVITVLLLN